MTIKLTKLLLPVLLALGVYGCSEDRLAGGGTDTEISIAGTVTKDDTLVDDALVVLENYSRYRDDTDASGAFRIDDVPAGTYTIRASKNMPDTLYECRQSVEVSGSNINVGQLRLIKTNSVVAKQAK